MITDLEKQIVFVNRKVTYRLYPSKKQHAAMLGHLSMHQQLYNAVLQQRIEAYRLHRKTLSFEDQCKELTALRKECVEFSEYNAQSQQVTLKRVDSAFKHFFRRVKENTSKAGFPRFRSLERFSGWGYKKHGDGWRLHAGSNMQHGFVRLSEIGNIKIRGKARTSGTPKTLEILYKQGRWYASVTVVCEPKRQGGTKQIGLDWGVSTFATIANDDGSIESIKNPRHLKKSLKQLKKAQRILSKKKRGSNAGKRARKQVAKLHSRVANRRLNFLHQQSALLISEVCLVATEKLNVKSMTAKGGAYKQSLNREILSTAPSAFLKFLRYKAAEAGIVYFEIPTREVKPSQTCYRCGQQAKKPLWQRWHECDCGASCSRDENAARVILAWAIKNGLAKGREPALCGADALASAAKHETPPEAAAI